VQKTESLGVYVSKSNYVYDTLPQNSRRSRGLPCTMAMHGIPPSIEVYGSGSLTPHAGLVGYVALHLLAVSPSRSNNLQVSAILTGHGLCCTTVELVFQATSMPSWQALNCGNFAVHFEREDGLSLLHKWSNCLGFLAMVGFGALCLMMSMICAEKALLCADLLSMMSGEKHPLTPNPFGCDNAWSSKLPGITAKNSLHCHQPPTLFV
jgi:hypothetical protein